MDINSIRKINELEEIDEYTIDRDVGIIDFLERVYYYAQSITIGSSTDLQSALQRLKALKHCMDGIEDYISSRYGLIDNPKKAQEIYNLIADLLAKVGADAAATYDYIRTMLGESKGNSWELYFDTSTKLLNGRYVKRAMSYEDNLANLACTQDSNTRLAVISYKKPDVGLTSKHTDTLWIENPDKIYADENANSEENDKVDEFPIIRRSWNGASSDGKSFILVKAIKDTSFDRLYGGDAALQDISKITNSFGNAWDPKILNNRKGPMQQPKTAGAFVSLDSNEDFDLFKRAFRLTNCIGNLAPVFAVDAVAIDLSGLITKLKRFIPEVKEEVMPILEVTNPILDTIRPQKVWEKPKTIIVETPGIPPEAVFAPITSLTRQNNDEYKTVEAMYLSIYRTDEKNELINSLIWLGNHNVKVFVYIEIQARGNEKANIDLATKLSKCRNIFVKTAYYGMKVHMKSYLIQYTDNRLISMVGTGNFCYGTLRSYRDLHLLSNNSKIGMELLRIYQTIFTNGKFPDDYEYYMSPYRSLYISPVSIRPALVRGIRGAKSRLFVKANHFCDKPLMVAVKRSTDENAIEGRLLIRTSCSLPPKSGHIKVRSKTGEHLEHARLYAFDNSVYLGSADLLHRNMAKRVELLVKIPEECKRIFTSIEKTDTGVRFHSMTIDDYIEYAWDTANFEMDDYSLRWKHR